MGEATPVTAFVQKFWHNNLRLYDSCCTKALRPLGRTAPRVPFRSQSGVRQSDGITGDVDRP
ncbi:hypothetical protein ACNO8S_17580 (plasmid) [Haloarcula sp. KBTZ06]